MPSFAAEAEEALCELRLRKCSRGEHLRRPDSRGADGVRAAAPGRQEGLGAPQGARPKDLARHRPRRGPEPDAGRQPLAEEEPEGSGHQEGTQ